jgi:hypothetical protein
VPDAQAVRCGKAYSYAGVVSARTGDGIRAKLTVLSTPDVPSGHVGAWVGVGGVGQGPGGSTEWIQAGYSGFAGGESHLYYEVVRPGGDPVYTEVKAVAVGETNRVAVAEMRGRLNWWRVWVNGQAVSQPVRLPGSHRRWAPIATAESWNGDTGVCNGFAFRFARLAVAARPNAGWYRLRVGETLADRPYRVVRFRGGFVARTRAP